ERSPNDWFALAAEIQRETEQADLEHRTIPSVNAEERGFIRKMLNERTGSAEAKQTPEQGQGRPATKGGAKAKRNRPFGLIKARLDARTLASQGIDKTLAPRAMTSKRVDAEWVGHAS